MADNFKYTITGLRLILGVLFSYAGFEKLFDPKWTAAGYLKGSTGLFSDFFNSMAGNMVIDQLVIWGLILVGVCLLLGFAVRFASFWGILMMFLFYLSNLTWEHGPVDEHIIYIGVFATLASFGAGRHFGLDQFFEKSQFVHNNRWLLKLLG
jgi:thiosulfate dehydrogenase [quinone] large subunit